MKLHFVGDVHGAFGNLQDCIDRVPADLTIQVGDFGLYWNPNTPGTTGFSRPVHFIDGNHDNHPVLQGDRTDWPTNVFYLPRASRWTDPISINFLGGAESIDRHRRVEGLSWWPEEVPSREEFELFNDLPPAKIIVTHTGPKSIIERFARWNISDPTAIIFDKWLKLADYTPEVWVFGHMHIGFDENINGTRFVCLPCVHEFNDIPASDGLVLDIEDGNIIG